MTCAIAEGGEPFVPPPFFFRLENCQSSQDHLSIMRERGFVSSIFQHCVPSQIPFFKFSAIKNQLTVKLSNYSFRAKSLPSPLSPALIAIFAKYCMPTFLFTCVILILSILICFHNHLLLQVYIALNITDATRPSVGQGRDQKIAIERNYFATHKKERLASTWWSFCKKRMWNE